MVESRDEETSGGIARRLRKGQDCLPDRGIKGGQYYQASCLELLVTAFGDSAAEARNGLRQQVADYLEDCDNLGCWTRR